MSFIQRELDKVQIALRNEPNGSERYNRLYDVQQALVWALDPRGAKSPYDMVMGIESDPKEYDLAGPIPTDTATA